MIPDVRTHTPDPSLGHVVMQLNMGNASESGFIVPMHSGVWWENQAGGTCCAHPRVEGVFVPLPKGVLDEGDMCVTREESDVFYDRRDRYSDGDTFLRVATWISDHELGPFFEPVRGAEERHALEVMEAWIPVRIRDVLQSPAYELTENLTPFLGRTVFLVYPNSD